MTDLSGLPPRLADRVRRQLQGSAFMIKASQVFVGGVLPIVEAVLVNLATGSGDGGYSFVIALIAVAILHLALFLALLTVETPLPQLLSELDELTEKLEHLRAEKGSYESYTAALGGAIAAVQYGLIGLEQLRKGEKPSLQDAFAEVLLYWVEERTAIFFFARGDALFNFAVYLESPSERGLLEVAYRSHDDRLAPTNRAWSQGDGHVGTCFLRKEIIFFTDEEAGGAAEYAVTTQPRDEDAQYYRSMMAAPILTEGGEARGVFIVTSSTPGQFVRQLHGPIMDVISRLLAQALGSHEANGGEKDGEDYA